MQVVEVKTPVLLVVKVTVPVALLGLTVAVQLVAILRGTDAGEHTTDVVVAVFWLMVTRNVPLLLVWTLSPP